MILEHNPVTKIAEPMAPAMAWARGASSRAWTHFGRVFPEEGAACPCPNRLGTAAFDTDRTINGARNILGNLVANGGKERIYTNQTTREEFFVFRTNDG